jgi:alpha-amylase/alpha-mannosidase (GH57 family)
MIRSRLKKIKFAIGIHNHQPIGNFDFVFEDAYQKAYLPFLEVLAKHPRIKIALHYSGYLFEWLLNRDLQFGVRLKNLVASGQVEMMSGGYYEPILVNIPDEDKFGQIEKLNKFVKQHTGYDPVGLWLAERIWEPQLPKMLAQSGAKYVVIDDSHFKSAGLEEKDLFGYYVTEETGYVVNIFPISERLRYTMPFQGPEVTMEYLRSVAGENGDKLIVFADDGEKFGIWPGTYEHCYQNQWLEKFFSLLEANLDWIEIIHFSEALEQLFPIGRVYLPTASYREMMEWALPAKAIEEYEQFEHRLKDKGLFEKYQVFVRGGFWRNFLAKYPESNNLHKKSLWVSKKVHQLKGNKKYDQKLVEKAKDYLWAGQTNCPYWHGVFGGLYLNNLRFAVYNNMIQAEAQVDQIVKTSSVYEKGWIDIQNTDFDADGRDELIVETKLFNLYFTPHTGGTLFELDYKPKAINLLDTMTRRKEAYHNKLLNMKSQTKNNNGSSVTSIHDLLITKEPGLEKNLKYDWYRRTSLVDHFLAPDTKLDQFANCEYVEQGDFVQSPYEYETERAKDWLNISMSRHGTLKSKGHIFNILVVKNIKIDQKSSNLIISYELKNLERSTIKLWFAPEFNYALLSGNTSDRYYYFDQELNESRHLGSNGIVKSVQRMGLKDEWLKIDIQLTFKTKTTIWRFPVETISQSEGGFERVYQSSVVVPNWKIQLDPLAEWSVEINQKIIDL